MLAHERSRVFYIVTQAREAASATVTVAEHGTVALVMCLFASELSVRPALSSLPLLFQLYGLGLMTWCFGFSALEHEVSVTSKLPGQVAGLLLINVFGGRRREKSRPTRVRQI